MSPFTPLLAASALLFTACAPLPPGSHSPIPDSTASCDVEVLSSEFVGQDASVLLAATSTTPICIIRPGDAMMEDFNPARINFVLDANERVTQVYCG